MIKPIVARMFCVGLTIAPLLAQEPKTWTTAEDHQHMLAQLRIRKLRPGPSGNPLAPNQANYDESKANPFPVLPDTLVLKNGTRVTTSATWWKERRPEIVEDFEREVVGRIPRAVPIPTWTVVSLARGTIGRQAAIGKQLVGHAGWAPGLASARRWPYRWAELEILHRVGGETSALIKCGATDAVLTLRSA